MHESAGPAPQLTSALRMYAAVTGVGIACAICIVTVYQVTKPIIRNNRVAYRQQAIFDVLPAARVTAAFRWDDEGGFQPAAAADASNGLVFAGFDEHNGLVGLAIEAEGTGYQDLVRVLYAYSFDKQAVIGLRVLESRETPGLGDRVETDAAFLQNFEKLDVSLSPDTEQLVHEIEFVKPGTRQSGWQIDGISGATVTSGTIAEMLRESTAIWIPRVNQHRAVFQLNAETASPRSTAHDQ